MKKIFLAALVVTTSLPAFAGNAYVGAAAGRAEQKLSAEGYTLSENSTGFSIAAGYQVNSAFAVEAGYVHFGEASVSGDGATASAKPKSLYAAVVGTLPLTPSISIFAKLGAAHNKTTIGASYAGVSDSTDETRTNALAGIGASYAINDKIAVVAEYVNFGKVAKGDSGESLKADLLSVGVRFKF